MVNSFLSLLAATLINSVARRTEARHLSDAPAFGRYGPRNRHTRKRLVPFRPHVEGLEERWVPQALTWKGTQSNAWGNANNWAPNQVPGPNDDVTINLQLVNPDPVFSGGNGVQSIAINGGRLTVQASLSVAGAISLDATGSLFVGANVTANQVSNAGILKIYGGATLTAAVSNATGGLLDTGAGTNSIVGNLSNAGVVTPGGVDRAPGSLNVFGNFSQTDNGSLYLYGSGNMTTSVLAVSGTATLGGSLFTASDGTANPTRDKTLTVVTAGSVSGTFANDKVQWGKYNWRTGYGDTDVVLFVAMGSTNAVVGMIPAQATVAWSGLVAKPSDIDAPGLTAADYQATIDWGDQTAATNGTVTHNAQDPPTTYRVSGGHTYATPGNYTTTITFKDTFSNVPFLDAHNTFSVFNPPNGPMARVRVPGPGAAVSDPLPESPELAWMLAFVQEHTAYGSIVNRHAAVDQVFSGGLA